jgi:hypothetical protein
MGMAKDVLAGDFLRLDRCDRNASFVSEREQQFGGTENVAIAHDEVKVAILAKAGIGVATLRENGALDHEGCDPRAAEARKKAEHFGSKIQCKKSLMASPSANLFQALGRNNGFVAAENLRRGEGESAVVFGECNEGGPSDGPREIAGDSRCAGTRFRTLQQQRPFGIENFSFAWRNLRQSQPPGIGITNSANA